MGATAQNLISPNQEDMRKHVTHLFGGYLHGMDDGRIELCWSSPNPDANGRYALSHGETFTVDQIDELVAKAATVNAKARTNVYIGAALRKPDTPPMGRCSDNDFYATTCYWADLDDQDANARSRVTLAGAFPTLVVRTGDYPHPRHQAWWLLSEPLTDASRLRVGLNGIAVKTGGDLAVINESRVMRLAGSIAWDQKPGRRPELTSIVPLETTKKPLRAYAPEHLERVFPPVFSLDQARINRAPPGPNLGVVRERNSLGLETGKVIDGREKHMTRVICAGLIEYCGQFGAEPTPEELCEHAWGAYEQSTDFSRPGRGKDEFLSKCTSTLRRFQEGKIKGIENLDAAVATFETNRTAQESAKASKPDEEPAEADAPTSFIQSSGEFVRGFVPPDYIVDGILQRRFIYTMTARTGAGKTALALVLATQVALGKAIGKYEVTQGRVLYFAGENPDDVRMRWIAMAQNYDFDIETIPVCFVPGTFKISQIMARVSKEIETHGDISLVIVDTSAAYFEGDDENHNVQAGMHARQLRSMVNLPGGPCVVVLCHPVKNAAADNLLPRGGGAFIAEVDGNLTANKDDSTVELHWQGKFRGPDFAPLQFLLKTVTHERLKTSRGRLIPTVIASHLTEDAQEAMANATRSNEDRLLVEIERNGKASLTRLAVALGWYYKNGGANKTQVKRAADALAKAKFITRERDGFAITEKGRQALPRQP